jgi:type IV pilus assembly protein PilA
MSMPPPPTHNASPASQPPKKGLSGCAIAAIILAVVGVFGIALVGILAAIAIPQYQEYVNRTRVVQAMTATVELQGTIDTAYGETGRCPTASELGITSERSILRLADAGQSAAISMARLEFMPAEGGSCAYQLRFQGRNTAADGKTLRFVRSGAGAWDCRGGDLPAQMRPTECR